MFLHYVLGHIHLFSDSWTRHVTHLKPLSDSWTHVKPSSDSWTHIKPSSDSWTSLRK